MPIPCPPSRFAALRRTIAVATSVLLGHAALAADQTLPGPGNAVAATIASQSPLVQVSWRFLLAQAGRIRDPALRTASLDALANPRTCVLHRRGLAAPAEQDAVVRALMAAGLIGVADAAAFAPGVRAGVFPPVLEAASDCPQLPQPIRSAPGSAGAGHHSYPGGLMVHESNNDLSDVNLASQYQATFGDARQHDAPPAASSRTHGRARPARRDGELPIDLDVILAAPIWHDWAKSMVFQWNADGTEFEEFNFGGNGVSDAWGAPGDSRTGGHHILSVAESMTRGFSPLMVIAQACAHSAPTSGNEYKVVNWLRAAAIIARIDPVAAGYLMTDATGRLRLPALGRLGDVDLLAKGQPNLRVEYTLHNLSDADYTFSGPAVASADALLSRLAPEFGFDPTDVRNYNLRFRHPALSHLSGERLVILYGTGGLEAVRGELQRLRQAGAI